MALFIISVNLVRAEEYCCVSSGDRNMFTNSYGSFFKSKRHSSLYVLLLAKSKPDHRRLLGGGTQIENLNLLVRMARPI